jgi:hypothetical protein
MDVARRRAADEPSGVSVSRCRECSERKPQEGKQASKARSARQRRARSCGCMLPASSRSCASHLPAMPAHLPAYFVLLACWDQPTISLCPARPGWWTFLSLSFPLARSTAGGYSHCPTVPAEAHRRHYSARADLSITFSRWVCRWISAAERASHRSSFDVCIVSATIYCRCPQNGSIALQLWPKLK